MFQDQAGGVSPVPAHHCLLQSYVSKDLCSAGYVFVRHDAPRSSLRPPYDGSFLGPQGGAQDFPGGRWGGHSEQVSVDRLKPAHVFPDEPVELARAPRRAYPPPQKECCWRPGPGYCVVANCGLSFPARPIGETLN